MATAKRAPAKSAAAKTASAPKKRATRRPKKAARKTTARKGTGTGASRKASVMPDFAALAKSSKLMTPEQAIELYKANTRLALEVINAAVESSTRMRDLQLAGAAEARAFGERQMRNAAGVRSPDALVAAGQDAAKEAVERAIGYWNQMFELISEMQKRLFTLIEAQVGDAPGGRELKAAMAMMPDLTKAQNLVRAMQGMVSSGGNAMERMQKVMGDIAQMGGMTRR